MHSFARFHSRISAIRDSISFNSLRLNAIFANAYSHTFVFVLDWIPAIHANLCCDLHVLLRKRLASHAKSSKNEDLTLRQMLHHFNARLAKPQRLVSLTYEEEERRALRSWNRFDFKLHQACFMPVEELANVVRDPEGFRREARNLIIFMNDQIPMWLKLKPGMQVYAEFDFQKGKHEMNLGRLSGGGSQAKERMLREDDEDEVEGINEGMTQLRGEAAKDQDKFRITVEREQRCYAFCDDNTEPKFVPGTTSVTFTGAHFG